MSDYLPRDVWIDVLVRLPLKNLVQYSCVCKSWYSLITSPNFISIHLNHSTKSYNDDKNGLLLIRHYDMFDKICRIALHFDDEMFDAFMELPCPFDPENEYLRIVGSCNGLICLSDDYNIHTDNIYVWNPLIRKSVVVPEPRFEFCVLGLCLLGFGFDRVRNDYKIVRILYETRENNRNFVIPPKVEVYSLSTGNWRSLCDGVPNLIFSNNSQSPPFVNGAVHWVAAPSGDDIKFDDTENVIVAFDMVDEVFSEIKMPASSTDKNLLKLSVMASDSSLALVEYEKIWQSDYCWVWVMKEYGVRESWTRMLTIDMRGGIRTLVGFGKHNEVLLSARVIGMASFDTKEKQLNYIGIHGTDRSFYASPYVESLVLLDRADGVSRQETLLPEEEGRADDGQ